MIDQSKIKKILIPRFDTHGDVILLKGFIDSLLFRYPEAEITLFVRDSYDQLAPLFSQRLIWRTQPYNPWARYSNDELKGVYDVLHSIAVESWDLVLFTTYNRTFLEDILAAMLRESCCIAIGREVHHLGWQQRAFTRLNLSPDNLYDQIVPVEERSHETEKFQLLWERLFDTKEKIFFPRIDVPEKIQAESDQVLQNLGLVSGSYVACMPAGLQNITIKKWPEERFAEVLVWLSAERGFAPLLVGHESERDVLEKVKSLVVSEGVQVQLWIGRQGDMALLGALLHKAGLYLGNDSAPMHLAAALGTPVVGIFGGGHWPRFNPVGSRCLAVTSCLPCYYCEWQCIFGDAPCVKLVTVDDVKAAIIRTLDGSSDAGGVYHAAASLHHDAENMVEKVFRKCKGLQDELAQRQEVIDALTYSMEDISIENEQANDLLKGMNSSLSWRLTAPLRKMLDIFRRL